MIVPVFDGLTALAGGGQAGATQLREGINRFTTVATAGDSVQLPLSTDAPGREVIVANAGTNYMNVFPGTGEIVNGLAANSAIALAAGRTALFLCTGPSQWHVAADGLPSSKAGSGSLIVVESLAVAADAAATLTAAQLIGGNIEGPITAARTYTLDTAVNLDAAIPQVVVGDTFQCVLANTSAGAFAITLAAGVGVTIKGSNSTIGQNRMAILNFRRTGVGAWTCYVNVSG